MHIDSFELERYQSQWDHRVAINLAESGVLPLSLAELLHDDPGAVESAMATRLGYPQTNGSDELRGAVAALHEGSTGSSVLVTNGGAEANFLAIWRLVEAGDEVVALLPNYMQIPGLASGLGARVVPWWLRETESASGPRWQADLDELDRLVTPRTKLIAICSPNNPTGAALSDGELEAVARAASRHGAWVLSDEVYRGAERTDAESPSMWGRYERVLVTGGLSKAYGLPGLRVGWMVGPPDMVESAWGYHDYTTIACGALSERLARFALAEPRRTELVGRARCIVREQYLMAADWVAATPGLSHVPPDAGAIMMVRFRHDIDSRTLIERLRVEHDTLIVPGGHFDLEGHVRLGFGYDRAKLAEGLRRFGTLLGTLPLA